MEKESIKQEITEFEVINKGTPFEPNYKRFVLDSYIKWKCPNCGHINETYGDGYYSFPTLNKVYKEELCCNNCEKEDFFVKIMIKCELVKNN
jgi:hypothetical protein